MVEGCTRWRHHTAGDSVQAQCALWCQYRQAFVWFRRCLRRSTATELQSKDTCFCHILLSSSHTVDVRIHWAGAFRTSFRLNLLPVEDVGSRMCNTSANPDDDVRSKIPWEVLAYISKNLVTNALLACLLEELTLHTTVYYMYMYLEVFQKYLQFNRRWRLQK